MIKVFTNSDWINSFKNWYKDYLNQMRSDMRDIVEKSNLNRADAISKRFLSSARITNCILGIPPVYVVGHCIVSEADDGIILIDFTDVDLDNFNEVEFVLV